MLKQTSVSNTLVIETAGAAHFVETMARQSGKKHLAGAAGGAALHLEGVTGLSDGRREDTKRVLSGTDGEQARTLLDEAIARGGIMAPAAEAVLLELTDPAQFWREIQEAKALARMASMPVIPDDIRLLERGFYGPGPISAVDLPMLPEE